MSKNYIYLGGLLVALEIFLLLSTAILVIHSLIPLNFSLFLSTQQSGIGTLSSCGSTHNIIKNFSFILLLLLCYLKCSRHVLISTK